MLEEGALPNFFIPRENIDRIRWKAPTLHYGLPKYRVKAITEKFTRLSQKDDESEKEYFGYLSSMRRLGTDNNVFVFDENISTGKCKVLWNQETNEVLKVLDTSVYAHYDIMNDNPMEISFTTIEENVFKALNIDFVHLNQNIPCISPHFIDNATSYLNDIDEDISDSYNECLEQIISTPLGECPALPQRLQQNYEEQNDVDENDHGEREEDNSNEETQSSDNDEADASSILSSDDSVTQDEVVLSVKSTVPSVGVQDAHHSATQPIAVVPNKQHILNCTLIQQNVQTAATPTTNGTQRMQHHLFKQTYPSYLASKGRGMSDLMLKISALQLNQIEMDKTITVLQQENTRLCSIIENQSALQQRITQLEQELNATKMHVNTLMQTISQIKANNAQLKYENNILIQRINSAKPQRITKEHVMQYFDSTKPVSVSELGWNIQKEMFRNAHVQKEQRIYTEKTKKFYWIINSQSASSYETLRTVLPVPCYNTIHSALRKTVMTTECSLLDIKYASSFSDSFLSHYTKGQIKATLAIDALVVTPSTIETLKKQYSSESPTLNRAFNTQIAFKDEVLKALNGVFDDCPCSEHEIKEMKEMNDTLNAAETKEKSSSQEKPLNNVFVFYVEPLNPEIPCYPVHIWLQAGGSANETVRRLTDHVINQVQQSGKCIISDISTDGDGGHQEEYQKALIVLLSISPTLDIDVLCDALSRFKFPTLAAADMLHFIKTMRTRTLLNALTLFPDRLSILFVFSELSEIFGNGHEVTDLSQIGKMRDVYPIQFFALKNLNILISKNQWHETLMFMPWSLWIAATMNT